MSIFPPPLLKSFVGFDQLFEELSQVSQQKSQNYPAFDISKKVGRVIKADDLAVFKPTLEKVKFIEGEKIEEIGNTSDASGYVAKDGWDENSQILKLNNVLGTFTKNEKISSNYTNSKSIIQEAYDFNFSLTIDSTIDKSTDWDTDKGKLNFDSQRVHDNDYYQRFSYSIKGEVPYENWKEPIQSLGHISGYKPFGDLEILNGVGHTVGMTTQIGRLNLNVEIGSKAAVYERLYYDRVTEEADFDNISTLISFDSKIITDYNESRTNKVLLIYLACIKPLQVEVLTNYLMPKYVLETYYYPHL